MSGFTVLMLTDDSHFYRRLGWVLDYKGYLVLRVGVNETLGEAIQTQQFDLILAQVTRVGGEELAILKQVKSLHPRVRIILCSSDRETAFPVEAYQLEVDDYLFMPCRLGELWRRVATCLKRGPEPSRDLAAAPLAGPLNRTLLDKSQRVFDFFRYNLGSSASALKTVINAAGARQDEKLMAKIYAVAARLEMLQEMAEGVLRGISGVELVNGFGPGAGQPAFPLWEKPAPAAPDCYPLQLP